MYTYNKTGVTDIHTDTQIVGILEITTHRTHHRSEAVGKKRKDYVHSYGHITI